MKELEPLRLCRGISMADIWDVGDFGSTITDTAVTARDVTYIMKDSEMTSRLNGSCMGHYRFDVADGDARHCHGCRSLPQSALTA
jgi:hypothetical protein